MTRKSIITLSAAVTLALVSVFGWTTAQAASGCPCTPCDCGTACPCG